MRNNKRAVVASVLMSAKIVLTGREFFGHFSTRRRNNGSNDRGSVVADRWAAVRAFPIPPQTRRFVTRYAAASADSNKRLRT